MKIEINQKEYDVIPFKFENTAKQIMTKEMILPTCGIVPKYCYNPYEIRYHLFGYNDRKNKKNNKFKLKTKHENFSIGEELYINNGCFKITNIRLDLENNIKYIEIEDKVNYLKDAELEKEIKTLNENYNTKLDKECVQIFNDINKKEKKWYKFW